MPQERTRSSRLTSLFSLLLLLMTTLILAGSASAEPMSGLAAQESDAMQVLSREDFSPSFLGIYRKVMEIEDNIVRYSEKYNVDVTLARAVCMYESGGDANLTSRAGARGYFQVMPATFRSLNAPTNIEAGIKYLGQMVRQFGREDYALAAYNGGPTRVARGRAMPLESLQYVIGVGVYRSVLKMHEPLVRTYAERLEIESVRPSDDWWRLAQRLGVPLVQLRLYNPFLAARTIRPGSQVVYPREPRQDLFEVRDGNALQYRTRLGDNYIHLAFALGADLDALREANGLWRLEPLLAGTLLTIPFHTSDALTQYRVTAGDDLGGIAERFGVDPWSIVRDNLLWDEQVHPAMVLRIRENPPPPKYLAHRIRRGDSLTSLARRYNTTVNAIQAANSMGRATRIRIGQQLQIPTR